MLIVFCQLIISAGEVSDGEVVVSAALADVTPPTANTLPPEARGWAPTKPGIWFRTSL